MTMGGWGSSLPSAPGEPRPLFVCVPGWARQTGALPPLKVCCTPSQWVDGGRALADGHGSHVCLFSSRRHTSRPPSPTP